VSWPKLVFPGWISALSVDILFAALTSRRASALATTADASVE
jgi:hypothetical protein